MGGSAKELDERSREVLSSVVCTYIRSAAPVSSRQLTRVGSFTLSSASLRNAMADLEDLGYLTHPHVSAGRVPTDRGYRAFVSDLMHASRPSEADRRAIERELGSGSFEMDRFLQTASKLLSKLTGEVGIVAAPDVDRLLLEAVHFTRVAERKVLVVQVSEGGMVDSRLVETREDFRQSELDTVSRQLTEDYRGRSLLEISHVLLTKLTEEKVRFDAALARTLELARLAFTSPALSEDGIFLEGTETILEKPDYQDLETLRRMFRAFEERARLVRLLTDCMEAGEPATLIGSENPFTAETQSAVVAAAYRQGDRVLGVLGVIGPRRMEYSRVIPMVEELARYVTRRLTERSTGG